jgi:UDP-glucose 4-epimerase
MKKGATILVTGGTGSFGGVVVDRLLKDKEVSRIIVFSRDEKKQHDMRVKYSGNNKNDKGDCCKSGND